MVDFKKRLAGRAAEKPTDPVKLYETLDRAHDKGPLRPAQMAVLKNWFDDHQGTRDIIVKLHTGQGKTLIGLLMLQARLNAGKGSALYLCPDNYLIAQTCDQAKQFGIATCTADWDLPDEFINGDKMLVASVQKLFNGITRFGLHRQSIGIETFLMDAKPKGANEQVLRLYAAELEAEESFLAGDYSTASEKLQALLDSGAVSADDKGWYLQEMARYQYRSNRTESGRLQVAAHKNNRFLLKPASGVTVAKLTILSQGRVERMAKWVSGFGSYSDLDVSVSDILGRLVFGMKADKFEGALDELSRALGFAGERPDKEWKEGPDNLWALDDTQYLLWECKNEVEITRAEINKREAEQMNRSCAWFDKHYQGMSVKRIIVHPSNTVQSAAAFTHDVEAMREAELKKLVKAAAEFFKSFESLDFKDLSAPHIQKMINAHKLAVPDFLNLYTKKLYNLK